MSTINPLRKPTRAEIATGLLRRLEVPVPDFKPHKRNPRERVNPLRRAKKAIRKHYGITSGRQWKRFKRWVMV